MASVPTTWGLSRYASNPVITIAPGNPAEAREQYDPCAVKLANGDIWCYVKGNSVIYAWKSTDGGVTFSLQNGGAAVLGHGSIAEWDNSYVLEPVVVYDSVNDVIHLWYKGRDANPVNWQWGHATAPGSTPTVFTKDAANPVLTKANAQTDLGGGTTVDLGISDVILIGSTYHFYGYGTYDSGAGDIYRLLHATGTTWNNPSGLSILASAAGASAVLSTPAVFRLPGTGTAMYGMLYSYSTTSTSPVAIRFASSTDGATWDFSSTTDIMAAGSGWESAAAFAGHILKGNTSPWAVPIVDTSNRWRFYFSGLNGSNEANSGLAYFTPNTLEAAGPGVWLDFNSDGFNSSSPSSEAGELARMMPEGGGTSVGDEITTDVISYTITRGATGELIGGSISDSATIIVQNSDGKYSPDNTASTYASLLRPGRPVWIGVNADGTLSGTGQTVYGRFAGVLREVAPIPVGGAAHTPTAELICDGILADYALTPAQFSDSTTRSQDDYRTAILDAIAESDDRRDLDIEADTLPLSSLDTTNALGALEDLNRATGSRHFIAPDSSRDIWYRYTTRNRNYKLGASADATVDAGSQHVIDIAGWRYNNDGIVNSQRASVDPIGFGPATATVWTYDAIPFTVAGNVVIWANFTDYVDAPSLSVNTSSGSVTSVLTPFGHSAKIELYSSGAQVTGLSITGRQVVRDSGVKVSAEDLASQAAYRVRAGSDLSGDLLGSQASAQGIVDHIVYRYGSRALKRPSLTVVNWLPTMFTLDPYDLLAVTVSALDASAVKFDIVGLSELCTVAASSSVVYHQITFQLQEARIQGTQTWFTLDTSLLNGSDLLGY